MSPPHRACLFFLHGGFVHVVCSFQSLSESVERRCVCLSTLSPCGSDAPPSRSDNTCRSFGSASAHVTSGRSGGIVACWDHCVDSQAGTSRKGDQPKNWRATDPNTSGRQPQNWTGRRCVLTSTVSSSTGKSGPSRCPKSQARLPQVCLRRVGGRGFFLLAGVLLFCLDFDTCLVFLSGLHTAGTCTPFATV